MIELVLRPTAAGSTHQRDGSVYLRDPCRDGVALSVQRRSVCRSDLDVVGNTGVIALVSVIGRALARGGSRFISLALIGEVMQSGQVVFDFLVGSQCGLTVGLCCLIELRT